VHAKELGEHLASVLIVFHDEQSHPLDLPWYPYQHDACQCGIVANLGKHGRSVVEPAMPMTSRVVLCPRAHIDATPAALALGAAVVTTARAWSS